MQLLSLRREIFAWKFCCTIILRPCSWIVFHWLTVFVESDGYYTDYSSYEFWNEPLSLVTIYIDRVNAYHLICPFYFFPRHSSFLPLITLLKDYHLSLLTVSTGCNSRKFLSYPDLLSDSHYIYSIFFNIFN